MVIALVCSFSQSVVRSLTILWRSDWLTDDHIVVSMNHLLTIIIEEEDAKKLKRNETKKRTIQLIHHRLKSFERASLLVLLLALRFPLFYPLTPHLPPKMCNLSSSNRMCSECGHSQKGCEWVDKCLYDVLTTAHQRTNKRTSEWTIRLTHAYIHADVIQHLVQLCAPFSVYFNSYSWRFLHDHNIEKPNAQIHARKYRFRIVILWTDRQWFWIKANKRKAERTSK